MQLSLSGHHVEVTQSMRSYVEKKFERISRHFDHVIDVHCVLTVEKLRQKAEATLHVRGNSIHADYKFPAGGRVDNENVGLGIIALDGGRDFDAEPLQGDKSRSVLDE